MRNLTLAFAAVLSLAATGCKKKGNEAVEKMQAFQKSMCACTDKACAEKVNVELTEWSRQMAKTAGKEQPDSDAVTRSAEARSKYSDCMLKLTAGGDPGKPAEPATAAAAAAAPAATCSATAWREPSGAFCVEAAGFTAGELSKGDGDDPEMKLYFTKKDKADVMFNVSWFPKREAKLTAVTAASNMDSDFKNNKGEDKGEFYGGKGRFVTFSRQDEPKSHKLYAVVQGNKAAYACEASSFDAPIDPEVLAACKSILPTD